WPSTLSASLKRSRHFAALAFAYLAILMSVENITDLFAPSLNYLNHDTQNSGAIDDRDEYSRLDR
ncbi:hypothetical protein Q4488_18340, partial [Amphritea sp. 1_MG-2023]|nr:hypothetical protein [Amphritea sp. 1_MG-2023]